MERYSARTVILLAVLSFTTGFITGAAAWSLRELYWMVRCAFGI